MRKQSLHLFILVVSLAVILGASGALARGPAPGGMRDRTAPQQQGQNAELVGQIGGITYAVAVQGDYAYIGVGPRLVILDVSDPTHPAVVGQTDLLPAIVQGVAVADYYAYVADGREGLRIIDVSNPSNPSEVGFYDTPGAAKGIVVSGFYAYVADGDGGLVTLRFAPYRIYLPLVLRNS